MKCVCMQYMEAIGRLIKGVQQGSLQAPLRTIHLSYLPDEEIGTNFISLIAFFCSILIDVYSKVEVKELWNFESLNSLKAWTQE